MVGWLRSLVPRGMAKKTKRSPSTSSWLQPSVSVHILAPFSSSSYQAYLLSTFPFYFLLPPKPRTNSSTPSGKSPPSLPSQSPSPSPLLQSLPVLITLFGRWEQGCILPISPEQPGHLCFSPTSVDPQSFRPEGSAPGGSGVMPGAGFIVKTTLYLSALAMWTLKPWAQGWVDETHRLTAGRNYPETELTPQQDA